MAVKYGMVLDTSKCIDCRACMVACRAANGVPLGHTRNWVKNTGLIGSFPNLRIAFQPGGCMHCDIPSCVAACPTGATYKAFDGRVVIDPERCIGCGNCIPACPYGARFFHPEKKIVDKCNFCEERLAMGLEPACVDTCPTKVRIFGDLNDPTSKISRYIEKNKVVQVVNSVVNTKPNLYYLAGVEPLDWPKEPTLPGGKKMSLAFWQSGARESQERIAAQHIPHSLPELAKSVKTILWSFITISIVGPLIAFFRFSSRKEKVSKEEKGS